MLLDNIRYGNDIPFMNELEPYLARLRDLPFVRGIDSLEPIVADGRAVPRISLKTPQRGFELRVAHSRMNLSRPTVDRYLRLIEQRGGTWVFFAPEIPASLGHLLAERGVNYVDLPGNCRVDLAERYIAMVEGRRAPRVAAHEKGLRLPGYQTLFALLAKPSLAHEPLRTIAARAEVSTQAVVDALARLVHDRALLRTERGYLWRPQGWQEAIERWRVGYHDLVRPRLLVGHFHAREQDPNALEAMLTPRLDTCGPWRWGGASAAWRVAPHYRGGATVVHLRDVPDDLARRLRVVPGRDGSIVVLRTLGEISLEGMTRDTIHPLLAWAELLMENNDRALEAAAEFRERALPPP